MTHEGTPCIRGCLRRNRHNDPCEQDNCVGCEPRTAQYGLLCWPCHRRLTEYLANGPNSLAYAEHWLQANLPKGSGSGARDIKIVTPDPDREPISLARYDHLQLLRDRVSGWLETLCGERNLTGPDVCNHLSPVRHRPELRGLCGRPRLRAHDPGCASTGVPAPTIPREGARLTWPSPTPANIPDRPTHPQEPQ